LGEVPSPPPPHLLDRLRHAVRVRHYSPRTEECYVEWVSRFIRFHGLRHPNTRAEKRTQLFSEGDWRERASFPGRCRLDAAGWWPARRPRPASRALWRALAAPACTSAALSERVHCFGRGSFRVFLGMRNLSPILNIEVSYRAETPGQARSQTARRGHAVRPNPNPVNYVARLPTFGYACHFGSLPGRKRHCRQGPAYPVMCHLRAWFKAR
jgi:hypothetical protein